MMWGLFECFAFLFFPFVSFFHSAHLFPSLVCLFFLPHTLSHSLHSQSSFPSPSPHRLPHFPHALSTRLYRSPSPHSRCLLLSHLLSRTLLPVLLLDGLNVIGRTGELSRLFGIDFLSVLTRGSQYRVESMLFRLTKPQNFLLVSPSKQQVAQQRAPECIPLVMEPQSRFYSGPVVVLDFQSLYPSIIIAYNCEPVTKQRGREGKRGEESGREGKRGEERGRDCGRWKRKEERGRECGRERERERKRRREGESVEDSGGETKRERKREGESVEE